VTKDRFDVCARKREVSPLWQHVQARKSQSRSQSIDAETLDGTNLTRFCRSSCFDDGWRCRENSKKKNRNFFDSARMWSLVWPKKVRLSWSFWIDVSLLIINIFETYRNCSMQELGCTMERTFCIDLLFNSFCSLSVSALMIGIDLSVLELIIRGVIREFDRGDFIVEGDLYSGHRMACLMDRVTVDLKGK